MTKQYFYTFDALRFLSFLLVFFHHTPVDSSHLLSFFTHSGGIGVSFFFVLSGFLISYILIIEKKNKAKISLKNFFIRRALRIWPLFYAMILFAYITPHILNLLNLPSSNQGYDPNWLMSILFLENYQMMITDSFPNISPLRVMWSLCVEEHFYIIWGILLYFIPVKKIPVLTLISIFFAITIRFVYLKYNISTADIFSNIDYFTIGAIPAYLFIEHKQKLNQFLSSIIHLKYLLVIFTLITIFCFPLINSKQLQIFSPTLFACLFSAVILSTLGVKNQLQINNYYICKLGVYTYSLYLFHTIFINLFFQILKNQNFPFKTGILFVCSLASTILFSFVSYHLFEKQFLKLKQFFY